MRHKSATYDYLLVTCRSGSLAQSLRRRKTLLISNHWAWTKVCPMLAKTILNLPSRCLQLHKNHWQLMTSIFEGGGVTWKGLFGKTRSKFLVLVPVKKHFQRDDDLKSRIRELAGQRLRCHCGESQLCHANAVLDLFFNEICRKKMMRPRAAEVFCGHAGVAAHLQMKGFEVVAVDWHGNKHLPLVPVWMKDHKNGGTR